LPTATSPKSLRCPFFLKFYRPLNPNSGYLDDFGTGYSSLSYLRGLPLDGLKIDRSFVNDLEHTEGGLAGAIVGMARQLGLETVAEGVETTLQLERLNKLGCERLQGFLFAHPMPAGEVEAMLRELGMGETPLE